MDLIVEKESKEWRAIISGQFTFSDNTRFRELLEAVKKSPPKELVIDISQLDYIDSAALGMLLLLREAAQATDMDVVIAGASGQVLKIFELSRFEELFALV